MALSFDDRLLRVGVEVQNQIRWYEGLQIAAQISKAAGPTQNDSTVRITNINKETRDYILTETTPFNENRVRKRLIVEAGRKSTGYFRLFEGDIVSVTASQPPDIMLTFKAKTGQWDKGNIVSKSNAAQTQLSVIAADAAKSMGLSLVFEATDKQIGSYYFVGAASKQVDKLAEAGGVTAYVDDGNLIVKDMGEPLRQTSHVLSLETGLIGIPEPSEQGIKCRYMLDPSSKLGGEFTLKSVMNPGLDGEYIIYKLAYEVSNRDEPFYTIVEAYKKGRNKPPAKGTSKVKGK